MEIQDTGRDRCSSCQPDCWDEEDTGSLIYVLVAIATYNFQLYALLYDFLKQNKALRVLKFGVPLPIYTVINIMQGTIKWLRAKLFKRTSQN